MNKKIILVLFLSLVLIAGLLISKNARKSAGSNSVVLSSSSKELTPTSTPIPTQTIPADKIEVVHFHGTHQCWSCITVGEYALSTIKEKFPDEYQSGKIVFKDINGELPENREIVIKYQARGSSLFVNAVRNGQDNIKEDTKVWYLVMDKEKFTQYFEDKQDPAKMELNKAREIRNLIRERIINLIQNSKHKL